jgi:hypothetical protein
MHVHTQHCFIILFSFSFHLPFLESFSYGADAKLNKMSPPHFSVAGPLQWTMAGLLMRE